MAVVIPFKGARGLVKAGVPADPPKEAIKVEYALTVQRITDLVSTPELFFETNPSFTTLQATVDKALNKLLKDGIINYTGTKPKRRGGCGGCARRSLLSFALQFSSRFQTVVLRAQDQEVTRVQLASDLRAYLVRRSPSEITEAIPITLYARLKNNKIRKVVL